MKRTPLTTVRYSFRVFGVAYPKRSLKKAVTNSLHEKQPKSRAVKKSFAVASPWPEHSLETLETRWYSAPVTTQFLTDDRGQKVAVVIPIADYESLMEDVSDLAAVAERRDDDRISLNELKEQLTADGLLPR